MTGKCTNNITEGYERAQPIPERLVADAIAPCTVGGIVVADESETTPSCEILVDWDYDWALDENGTWQEIVIHRYKTTFEPAFQMEPHQVV